MSNELVYPDGFPVTLQFVITDVNAGATTDGTLAGGNTAGWIVPAGYTFHALAVSVYSNAARTAGTATVKVTDDGTELVSGPEAVLNASNTTKASGVSRPLRQGIAAGSVVGVSATGDASWAPTTADFDVVVLGVLLPA